MSGAICGGANNIGDVGRSNFYFCLRDPALVVCLNGTRGKRYVEGQVYILGEFTAK